MKHVAKWFEATIENCQESKHWSTTTITILIVLVAGAGSLYMLLNTNG